MTTRSILGGLGLLAASAFLAPLGAQSPIGPGNLLVLRVGDGIVTQSSASTASFVDEFTPAGVLVQTIALPTAAASANQPLTNSGVAVSEGFLTVDGSGQFVLCGGYAIAPGTTNIASTASTLVQRVIGRIDASGAVDTTSTLGTAFNGFNIRSVASPDGVQFYATGSGGGVQYALYGGGTPVTINTAVPVNTRVANIFNGQLYLSSASGGFQGVGTLGTGLPTTSGQTPSLLPGFPTATGPSSYDYFLADPGTLYVADDRATGAGGIQKWTLAGGSWTLQYTLAAAPTVGCRGLCGIANGGPVTLFATTSTASANSLVAVVDTGAGALFTTLAVAASNTAFRGVRRFAAPASVAFAGAASPTTIGLPSIGTASGQPVIGNLSFQLTAGNLGAFGVAFMALGIGPLGPGFPVPGAPATVQIYVAPVASTLLLLGDPSGNATLNFSLPAVPAYIGTPVAAQVVAIDTLLPGPLPLGTSLGMQLVIGG